MTYLEIVNRVMRRLRENEVTTINETPYSKLIADLVNVVKQEVEDSWNWSVLRTTITINTEDDLFNYVLTDTGTRLRVFDVVNDTDDFKLEYRPTTWFNKAFQAGNGQKGSPVYYNFNGVSENGDSQMDLWPIPDGAYEVQVNIVMPQAELVGDLDKILVPGQIIVEGVLGRAISERGDDGGYVEQEARYRSILSDYIAMESAQRPDETIWMAV
jgi:hypothetical protein